MAPSSQDLRRTISLTDSIEVVIVQTETSTYFPPPPPSSATPWSNALSPSRSASLPPTHVLANFPIITSAPFSHYHSDALPPTPSSPPPNYSPNVLSTPHTTPLSFPSSSDSVDFNPPPPPSYRTVPRTHAESMFWWGFLCPLIFWPMGILHFWRAERPTGFADLEAAGEEEVEIRVALEEGMFGPGMPARCPSVKESLEFWREEERLWAKRCACSLVGFLVIGSVFIAVVVSVADLV